MSDEIKLDWDRAARLGFDEAIFCLNKRADQIYTIINMAQQRGQRLLLTRLSGDQYDALDPASRGAIDYDPRSATAWLGPAPVLTGSTRIVVITAGSSDANVAWEAVRTIHYQGINCDTVFDVGVAGLWRLLERVETLRRYSVVIAVAGMDAALPSVIGGLLPGAIIAVPTSTGYGVASGGQTALNAVLASCAPGVSVVNIDNGYGAACAALRIVAQIERQPVVANSS